MKILIDGNNVCHIVNHAMGYLSNEERKTGVIFGFMKQLLTLSNKMQSNDFIFCWDSRKSLRKKIYPEYKSNRNKNNGNPEDEQAKQDLFDQISEIRRTILPELGFNNNFIKTGYEADDLIAYTVLQNYYDPFTIVSTDQDLYQILNDKVRIYNIITKNFFYQQDFIDKFDLDPMHYKEIKAIAGCSSDYVKGISGVGEATAAKYIRNDKMSISLIEKIHEGHEIISRNRLLTYLPFSNGEGHMPNLGITLKKNSLKLSKFKNLFNQLSFNSFLKDMSSWERNFIK
jgi:DNA polymerase-1